jgi:hypothetical protein
MSEAEHELYEALITVTANLVAARSLLAGGGRRAAASDKMFSIMLNDYEKAAGVGRAALLKHNALLTHKAVRKK